MNKYRKVNVSEEKRLQRLNVSFLTNKRIKREGPARPPGACDTVGRGGVIEEEAADPRSFHQCYRRLNEITDMSVHLSNFYILHLYAEQLRSLLSRLRSKRPIDVIIVWKN